MKESSDKGQGNWDAHLMQVEELMKGQPFWKIALFGVMCAERQWPVYERLCVGREWGNAKGMRKVMERLWQAIPTGYAIGDSYMGIIEDSVVVASEDWDGLAIEYIQTMMFLLELFESKDKKSKAAPKIAERNLNFLYIYLDFEAEGDKGFHSLMAAEQEFQLQLAETLKAVENKDKKDCIHKCHEQRAESILKDFWFRDYPNYKPVKRKKSGFASDGLRFRTAHQTACISDKNFIFCWDADERIFAALEQYRASGYRYEEPVGEIPVQQKMAEIDINNFAKGEYYSFYYSMCHTYYCRAERLYLNDRPMEETLKALYQAAKCAVISARLFDMSPRTDSPWKWKKGREEWGYQHTAIYYAMLIYEYETAYALMDGQSSVYSCFLLRMLRGEYDEAEALLEDCRQKADPIYRGADYRLAAALCKRDPEEIRAAAIKMLQAFRVVEDLYREVFPMYLILAVRCTAQMGIPIRKIAVSELPEQLIGKDSPFSPKDSMPFGVEKLSGI